MLRNFPEFLSLHFVGPKKKILQNSRQTSRKIPSRKLKKSLTSFSFCRSAGRRIYPRSGFWHWGTPECTLVPVLVPGTLDVGEHPWRVSNAALANAALVLSSKNWKIYSRWGGASKNKSEKPWVCVFTLLPRRNRCRFSKSGFLFRRCTHHRK